MKVTLSTSGRFHAFNLVQQLQQADYLYRFISTYPTFAVAKYGAYGIDPTLYRSIGALGLLYQGWLRVHPKIKDRLNLQFLFHEQFDRAATQFISPESNLFVGWSSLCLYSLEVAKKLGAVTVVDRGNSHMQHFMEIMQEEYAFWGIKFNNIHPRVSERELQEYDVADKIAVPSLFVKRTFLERDVPATKLIHVPYGVSLKEFYPVNKEDHKFRVIHCGTISFRKGVQYLLQAFYELNLPDAELWLVGPVDQTFKFLLAKYESEKIILKGKQPQSQLRWFYSQASVFCLASIEEGLALVQPQAMACGLPIIHTENTGGEDIVRPNIDGFCIPIRDVEALKEKILFFYENPDKRAEMGQNALKQAHNFLSWKQYGTKMIAAYKAALKMNR